MHTAVILMEGGSEFDLKALDMVESLPESTTLKRTVSESQTPKRFDFVLTFMLFSLKESSNSLISAYIACRHLMLWTNRDCWKGMLRSLSWRPNGRCCKFKLSRIQIIHVVYELCQNQVQPLTFNQSFLQFCLSYIS